MKIWESWGKLILLDQAVKRRSNKDVGNLRFRILNKGHESKDLFDFGTLVRKNKTFWLMFS